MMILKANAGKGSRIDLSECVKHRDLLNVEMYCGLRSSTYLAEQEPEFTPDFLAYRHTAPAAGVMAFVCNKFSYLVISRLKISL